MGEGTVIEAAAGQRYVIERPRLTKLLDESNARIILLLAPAGYGKTTLARQWLAQGGRQGVWLSATTASGDVAALAANLAHAVNSLVPGTERQMVRHLQAVPNPERAANSLSRTLIDCLAQWPDEGWVVIDDYHFISVSEATEKFVESLITEAPVRLVVTSRRRPRWASARRVLYNEVAVIGPRELELTDSEARGVLTELAPETAADVVARAQGWAAVVRLAALTGDPALPSVLGGSALYEYFAEELFQTAPPELQQALLKFVAFPTLSKEVLAGTLGGATSQLCEEAVTLGFLTRDPIGGYELHPLLRAFLEAKFRHAPEAERVIRDAFERSLTTRRWDDAHSIVVRFELPDLYEPLFEACLAPMLAANRLSTLQEWVSIAAEQRRQSPLTDLTEAEIARRTGDFDRGSSRALHAARNLEDGSRHLSRAYAVASECAHFNMRGSEAATWGRHSEEAARTVEDSRRAIWAQLNAAVQFEVDDPATLLTRFEALADRSATSTIRVLIGRLLTSVFDGDVEAALGEAATQLSLVERSDDVLATTSFLYRLASTAVIAGHYQEALPVARSALTEIEVANIQFALPHATACLAAATIGLRRFRRASVLLDRLYSQIQQRPDPFEQSNWHALKARLLISMGAAGAAATEVGPIVQEGPTPALRGELLGLQALAWSVGEAPLDAEDIACVATKSTREVHGVTLAALARAIVALRLADNAREPAIEDAARLLRDRANYDSLVLAIRAYPPLLAELRRRNVIPEGKLASVVRHARDLAIAASVGWPLEPTRQPRRLLTPREDEVFQLLRKGLMNREIAQALFISESTVKVHVRHILEKLGARSRTEAVLRLQKEI